ncbi:sperm-associated antigen 1 isoform X1 [Octopus sinensis]|uniref:Sperm-associated antigen 1 isoform X1 n=1 Tax=Octopus sinensis TaxID=2607531 RepID=A0A6P7SUG0_9MOLL|nr:sperm-associated antigen 1 isoform X1 [Octopus sinensis]XP_029641833.1 sperm-associated antigen 1 isoform X1 [Octopus sinensis]
MGENTPLYFKENISKYQIPLDHIDFGYIKKCKDVKELEKIYKLLRSGEEGHYAELEKCCEEKLREMHPNSRALRREEPLKKITDLSQEENIALQAELENWSSNMCKLDGSLKKKNSKKAVDDIPPIRNAEGKKGKPEKEKKKGSSKKASPKPRDIKEWDKFDVEGELKRIDEDVQEKPATKKVNSEISKLSENVDIGNDCLEETKTTHALREKDKGNEAFRSGDYNEAVIYYNRSLSIQPLDVVYNNRALAYLKLSLWSEAIADCDLVLINDSNNVKALLRRASAYKENKEYNKSLCDLKTVLKLEPENQRAKQILSVVEKNSEASLKEKETPTPSKKKGRKLVIEEIEGNEEEVSPDINRNFLTNNFQNGKDAKEESPEKCEKVQESSKKNSEGGKQGLAKCNGKESKQRKNLKNKLDSKVGAEDGKQTSGNDVSNNCLKEADKNVTDVRASGDGVANNLVNDQNTSNELKDSSSQHCDSQTEEDVEAKPPSLNEHSPKVYMHRPLSPKILSMKDSGNDLFLRGRYSEALDYYTKAIDLLEQESIDQTVNLSLIYSNRAACSLKMGQCRNSISDCTTSLQLVPFCVKPLLRRAAAYETLEKYDLAYVDYRHVLAINNSVESALQGSSRCSQILIQQHGYSWRNKLPDIYPIKPSDIPVIKQLSDSDGTTESSKPSAAPVKTGGNKKGAEKPNKNETGKSNKTQTPNVEKATVTPVNTQKTLSKEEEFEQLKAQGNQFVKEEQYSKAIDCYSQCIQLFPDNAISYRNRALCYLKLNKASEAVADCDESLHLESSNIKTLFRRAQANKLLKNYRASISDLKNLLNLDPENSTAKKELEIGKNLWRQELNAMKANMDDNKTTKNCNKCSQESRPSTSPGSNNKKNSKQRTRLHVHDVEDDSSLKSSSKLHGKHHKNSKKSEGKVPEGSQSAGSNSSSKKNRSNSEVAGPTPVSAPHIDKATPYEFLKAWNSLKTLNNTKPYADLLAQITPKDLPMVISNKLDASMLNLIIQCVSEHYADKDSAEVGLEYLINLTKVARFQTIAMFLSSKEKSDLLSLINTLAENQSTYNETEILALRQDYGLK